MKELIWVGSSLKDLRDFPDEVKSEVGYALYVVENGGIPKNAKILKGIKPAVVEIVSNFNSDTFRTVYTVKLDSVVYVLHCFQKKSKSGIKTSKQDIDLIKQRLIEAKEISKQRGA